MKEVKKMALLERREQLTKRDIINRLSYLPDRLRDIGETEEAEGLDELIEQLKDDLNKDI